MKNDHDMTWGDLAGTILTALAIYVLIVLAFLLDGCGPAHTPRIIQWQDVKPSLDRYMDTGGLSMATAVTLQYGYEPDLM